MVVGGIRGGATGGESSPISFFDSLMLSLMLPVVPGLTLTPPVPREVPLLLPAIVESAPGWSFRERQPRNEHITMLQANSRFIMVPSVGGAGTSAPGELGRRGERRTSHHDSVHQDLRNCPGFARGQPG
jgi:hypothetical protein